MTGHINPILRGSGLKGKKKTLKTRRFRFNFYLSEIITEKIRKAQDVFNVHL